MKLRGFNNMQLSKDGIGLCDSAGKPIKIGDTVERRDESGGIYRATIVKQEMPGSISNLYSLGTQSLNNFVYQNSSFHYNSNEYTIIKESK